MFTHVLGGTLDGVLFRYQLLYADLVDTVLSWSSPEKFSQWSAIVYSECLEVRTYVSYSVIIAIVMSASPSPHTHLGGLVDMIIGMYLQ